VFVKNKDNNMLQDRFVIEFMVVYDIPSFFHVVTLKQFKRTLILQLSLRWSNIPQYWCSRQAILCCQERLRRIHDEVIEFRQNTYLKSRFFEIYFNIILPLKF